MISKKRYILSIVFLCCCSVVFAQIAVTGDIVHTVPGSSDGIIKNGAVLIKDGKIEAVGPVGEVDIPPDYEQIEGSVITPGLIDAHSVVGLAGMYNQPHDQDQLDKSGPVQPELRAMDGYNPREGLVEWIRSLGVTTLHTGHAPGALISGQSVIVKTHGNTLEEVLVDSSAMLTWTLGASVRNNFKSPGTRSKGMAMLRQELIKARAYQGKQANEDESKRPARDLKMDALTDLLEGKTTALITAHRVTEIMAALRLAREFDIKMVLDGAAESYLVLDELKSAGVSVLVHPTMVRNWGDTQNASYETASKLKDSGILFAFQSGYEGYVPKTRVILYEAAVAVANGLAATDALAAMTIDAARILGIEDRVGTLEVGKDADVVVYDGDPFEYTSHVCTVIVDGVITNTECH